MAGEMTEADRRFLEETEVLLDLEDEDRVEFVEGVIEWLLSRFKWVGGAEGKIKQAKRFKRFMEEFRERGKEAMVCALWTIKPEFRPVWSKVLAELVGIKEEVRF